MTIRQGLVNRGLFLNWTLPSLKLRTRQKEGEGEGEGEKDGEKI